MLANEMYNVKFAFARKYETKVKKSIEAKIL